MNYYNMPVPSGADLAEGFVVVMVLVTVAVPVFLMAVGAVVVGAAAVRVLAEDYWYRITSGGRR